METPAITIKIKGLQAVNAVSSNPQLLAGLKLKGVSSVSKGTLSRLGEIETVRVGTIKASKVAGVAELDGTRYLVTNKGALVPICDPNACITAQKGACVVGSKLGAGKVALGGKAVASTAAAAKGGAFAGNGWALWSMGLGPLGLGAIAGGIGIGVLGYYLYRRSQQLAEQEVEAADESLSE